MEGWNGQMNERMGTRESKGEVVRTRCQLLYCRYCGCDHNSTPMSIDWILLLLVRQDSSLFYIGNCKKAGSKVQ